MRKVYKLLRISYFVGFLAVTTLAYPIERARRKPASTNGWWRLAALAGAVMTASTWPVTGPMAVRREFGASQGKRT